MSKTLVFGLVCVLVFIVGFVLGRSGTNTPLDDFSDTVQERVETMGTQDTSAPPSNTEGGTPVSSQLSDGQRRLIESFGLNPDEITITPQMVACAEGKLGAARIAEIQNGATPSFSEGASLLACYRQ